MKKAVSIQKERLGVTFVWEEVEIGDVGSRAADVVFSYMFEWEIWRPEMRSVKNFLQSTRGQTAEARRTTILQPVEQKPHSQKDR